MIRCNAGNGLHEARTVHGWHVRAWSDPHGRHAGHKVAFWAADERAGQEVAVAYFGGGWIESQEHARRWLHDYRAGGARRERALREVVGIPTTQDAGAT